MSAKIVCAWCQSMIVASNNPVASVSHGICRPCKAKLDREIAALRSPLVDNEIDSFVDKIQIEEVYY